MKKENGKPTLYYKIMRGMARILFPRAKITYEETPEENEAAIYVCNHSNVCGPIMITLDFPGKHKTWALSYALDKEKCENYAFHDIFFGKSRKIKWFWRLLSKIMRSALPPLLLYSDTIPVYHDTRIIKTFKESIAALKRGENVVIFAESPKMYSEYINEMQLGFVDLARIYYRETGKNLKFYPAYVCKKHRTIAVARPIEYDPSVPMSSQRITICDNLSRGIDRMARSLPKHKPIPFLPKRWYDAYGEYENDTDGYWKMIGGESCEEKHPVYK